MMYTNESKTSAPHANPLINDQTTSTDISGGLGPVTLSGTLVPPSPLPHPLGVGDGEALMETSPPDVPSSATTPAAEEGIRVVTEDGPSDPDVDRPQSPSQENIHLRATNKNNKKRKRGKQPSPSRGGRSYRQTHWNPLPQSEPPPGVASDGSYPIYFILRSAGNTPLTKCSGIDINDALEKLLGGEEFAANTTRQRDGTLLIKASNLRQSRLLAGATSLADVPIASAPDPIRNSSQGTIYAPEYDNEPEDKILRDLKKRFPILRVHRFPPKRDTPTLPNPRLLITFGVPHVPSRIKLGYDYYSVRLFLPKPRRCFRCQKFGHPVKYCRATQETCMWCGEPIHNPCPNAPHCVNCQGNHGASSQKCPAYLHEEQILAESTIAKVDKREAARRIAARQAVEGLSYASVAASSPPTARRPPQRNVPAHTSADRHPRFDPQASQTGECLFQVETDIVSQADAVVPLTTPQLATTLTSIKTIAEIHPEPTIKPKQPSHSDIGGTERISGSEQHSHLAARNYLPQTSDRKRPSTKIPIPFLVTYNPYALLTPRDDDKDKIHTKSTTKQQQPRTSTEALQIVPSKAPTSRKNTTAPLKGAKPPGKDTGKIYTRSTTKHQQPRNSTEALQTDHSKAPSSQKNTTASWKGAKPPGKDTGKGFTKSTSDQQPPHGSKEALQKDPSKAPSPQKEATTTTKDTTTPSGDRPSKLQKPISSFLKTTTNTTPITKPKNTSRSKKRPASQTSPSREDTPAPLESGANDLKTCRDMLVG